MIQKANAKSSIRQHGPPTNAKVGSGAEESKYTLLTGPTSHVPVVEIMYAGLPVAKISMKTSVEQRV
jgi:hypothetical protein